MADQQLDELERRDTGLHDAVLTVCEHIFDHPQQAQSMSRAIRAQEGIRKVLSVSGFPPYEALWGTELQRLEAVSPYSFGSR